MSVQRRSPLWREEDKRLVPHRPQSAKPKDLVVRSPKLMINRAVSSLKHVQMNRIRESSFL